LAQRFVVMADGAASAAQTGDGPAADLSPTSKTSDSNARANKRVHSHSPQAEGLVVPEHMVQASKSSKHTSSSGNVSNAAAQDVATVQPAESAAINPDLVTITCPRPKKGKSNASSRENTPRSLGSKDINTVNFMDAEHQQVAVVATAGPPADLAEDGGSSSSSSSQCSDLAHHLETMHAGLKNAQILKSSVYGGIDGVITTFSIISSAHGAGLSYGVTVALGIANVLSDGFSMGFGDFISGKLEKSFVEGEKLKEITEFRRKPLHEMAEMVDMFVTKEQMGEEDAKTLVNVMAKYEPLFIANMMRYELSLDAETESEKDLVKNGVATFSSFILFGGVPLYVYLIGYAWSAESRDEIARPDGK